MEKRKETRRRGRGVHQVVNSPAVNCNLLPSVSFLFLLPACCINSKTPANAHVISMFLTFLHYSLFILKKKKTHTHTGLPPPPFMSFLLPPASISLSLSLSPTFSSSLTLRFLIKESHFIEGGSSFSCLSLPTLSPSSLKRRMGPFSDPVPSSLFTCSFFFPSFSAPTALHLSLLHHLTYYQTLFPLSFPLSQGQILSL